MLHTKILNLSHLDEIHALLNNHYIDHSEGIYRIVYPKDYLYWYLKMSNHMIGLVTEKNNLVGFIVSIPINIIENDVTKKINYINLLCVHKSLRLHGLASVLINKMKNDLGESFYYFSQLSSDVSIELINYAIPINEKKLYSVGFIDKVNKRIELDPNNPFHSTKEFDLPAIKTKLNNYLKKFKIKIHFDDNLTCHLLLPKKDIVYSFVNKSATNEITDFISFYKCYYFCVEKQKIISIATLGYYFYESLTLTEMINKIIPKLYEYNFDQLNFCNHMDNMMINTDRFRTEQIYFNGMCCKVNELGINPF